MRFCSRWSNTTIHRFARTAAEPEHRRSAAGKAWLVPPACVTTTRLRRLNRGFARAWAGLLLDERIFHDGASYTLGQVVRSAFIGVHRRLTSFERGGPNNLGNFIAADERR